VVVNVSLVALAALPLLPEPAADAQGAVVENATAAESRGAPASAALAQAQESAAPLGSGTANISATSNNTGRLGRLLLELAPATKKTSADPPKVLDSVRTRMRASVVGADLANDFARSTFPHGSIAVEAGSAFAARRSVAGVAHFDAWRAISHAQRVGRLLGGPASASAAESTREHVGTLIQEAWRSLVELTEARIGNIEDAARGKAGDAGAGTLHGKAAGMAAERTPAPASASGAAVHPQTALRHGRLLADTYADSLVHTNRFISDAFGRRTRKVPAHMPHMIEVAAMQKLQDRWPEEFSSTSARRFRDGDDVQYAFAYFHFLMEGGAREGLDVREYFDRELDVDADGVLSANELRTLGSIVMQHSPSDADVARLRDCLAPERVESSVERTEEFGEEAVEVRRRTSRPLITWSRLMECDEVVTGLSKHARFGATHQDMPHDEVSFEMLQDDFNKSSALLDGIRA
jgi:hypothetical protein